MGTGGLTSRNGMAAIGHMIGTLSDRGKVGAWRSNGTTLRVARESDERGERQACERTS
jgi:hypothetical protein